MRLGIGINLAKGLFNESDSEVSRYEASVIAEGGELIAPACAYALVNELKSIES